MLGHTSARCLPDRLACEQAANHLTWLVYQRAWGWTPKFAAVAVCLGIAPEMAPPGRTETLRRAGRDGAHADADELADFQRYLAEQGMTLTARCDVSP